MNGLPKDAVLVAGGVLPMLVNKAGKPIGFGTPREGWRAGDDYYEVLRTGRLQLTVVLKLTKKPAWAEKKEVA